MSRAVVVIPIYRERLEKSEQLSVTRLKTYLSSHERLIVAPDTLRHVPIDGPVLRFPSSYFESAATYSKLLLSPMWYAALERWEFHLIHQLDALVFRDELDRWCESGYDYIGAPIHVDKSSSASPAFTGNGGLSLRRTAACARVIGSTAPISRARIFIRGLGRHALPDQALQSRMSALWKLAQITQDARVGAQEYAARYSLNEDLFWSTRAHLFDPEFRVAPVEVAARFSIENFPLQWFNRIGNVLPFGCHAWEKWDRGFWLNRMQ